MLRKIDRRVLVVSAVTLVVVIGVLMAAVRLAPEKTQLITKMSGGLIKGSNPSPSGVTPGNPSPASSPNPNGAASPVPGTAPGSPSATPSTTGSSGGNTAGSSPSPSPSSPSPSSPTPSPTPSSPSYGQVCGTAGYNGNTASLPTFETKYPSQWRTDYSFADIWNTPGATYENFKIPTNIFAKSNNLLIRNFYINPASDYYVLRTDDREDGAGTTITNGTIAAVGATDNNLYKGIVAAVNNLTISDMDISGTHDGIGASGSNITISNVCIHDLGTAPTAHNDGIEVYSGSNITIRDSEIHNKEGQTSAINITNDYGAINEILIENVTLSGGGYTIYVRGDGANGGAVTNIRFRHVKISSPGGYGVISYQDAPGAIVEWDVVDNNGNAIPHP